MAEQLSMAPKIDADELVAQVRAEHSPVASVALFSGGNDSTVLAHRCRAHYDSLAFIDTGTAVPGVREHVESFAAWIDKPLRIRRRLPPAGARAAQEEPAAGLATLRLPRPGALCSDCQLRIDLPENDNSPPC